MRIDVDKHCNNLGSSIFLSGANGVGKTSLCNAVVQKTGVEHVTASSLLEQYASAYRQYAKLTAGGESEFICRCLEEILKSSRLLLVDGHFVLFDQRYHLVKVDQDIFRRDFGVSGATSGSGLTFQHSLSDDADT